MTRSARIETNEGDIGALLSVIGTKQTYEAQSMVRSGAHSGRSLIQCLRVQNESTHSVLMIQSGPLARPASFYSHRFSLVSSLLKWGGFFTCSG